MTTNEPEFDSIPVIRAGESGRSFVWYGDCCSGVPGEANAQNFAAVNEVFRRLAAQPDLVVFAGDNILGYSDHAEDYRSQWRYWLDHEMAWFYRRDVPIFHITSNHNTTNEAGEAVFREIHTDIPPNGPDDQQGLSYWVRDGGFLYVFVNTNFSGLGGAGHVEHEWLDRVLTEHATAEHKLVFGHHPVFGVNGYNLYPDWRIVPDEAKPFWDVLVRHGVIAYVCSHILLFDVQVHDGVLQIVTGGAGTYGMPTVGLMPDAFEYFHLVQAAVDAAGVRYQVVDTTGAIREWLQWPEPALEDGGLVPFEPENPPHKPGGDAWVARFRLTGAVQASDGYQTVLSGWQTWEGPEAIWIGTYGPINQLVVQLVPEPGLGAQRWEGPHLHGAFDIEIAIHSGMGPGGVLWRDAGGSWSSLNSTTARGASQLAWPERWSSGCGPSGRTDRPLIGLSVGIEIAVTPLEQSVLFSSHAGVGNQ